MKMEVTLEQAIGKTLQSVVFSEAISQCLLVFADDTFTTIAAETVDGSASIFDGSLDLLEFGDFDLVHAGVVTRTEIVAIRNDRDAKEHAARLAVQEAGERREFERLKKKFGGSNGINQGDRNG